MTKKDLPLELRIECIKHLGNLRLELLKSFYDRRSIAERYANGNITLHVHGSTSENRFCATWRKCNKDRALNSSKVPVFIRVGEDSKSFCPLASITRLKPLDSCDVFRDENSKVVSTEEALELLFRIYDRKLCAIYDLLGIKAGQLINQVIQGGSQILHNLSDKSADSWWGREVKWPRVRTDYPSDLSDIWEVNDSWLAIQGDTIIYSLAHGVDSGLQILQVLPCPTNPLISAIQRMHSPSVVEDYQKGKKTKGV